MAVGIKYALLLELELAIVSEWRGAYSKSSKRTLNSYSLSRLPQFCRGPQRLPLYCFGSLPAPTLLAYFLPGRGSFRDVGTGEAGDQTRNCSFWWENIIRRLQSSGNVQCIVRMLPEYIIIRHWLPFLGCFTARHSIILDEPSFGHI
jgi:hypothetical protein